MDLLVKEYLKTHSFQQLEDDHGVVAKPCKDGWKFSLNYDQIMVKSGDPVAEQCRGLVIRPRRVVANRNLTQTCGECGVPRGCFCKSNCKCGLMTNIVGDVDIVAWPMNRFYNHGDTSGADVDWSDANLRIYEKLDGTMTIVYWDDVYEKWCVGTRSVCNADLPIFAGHTEIGDLTFSGLFMRALEETYYRATAEDVDAVDLLEAFDKSMTYVFELTSPFNRIVVKYDVPCVTLLAVRETQSGKEIPIEKIHAETIVLMSLPRPKTWQLKTVAALDAFVNAANPDELEGAVICDSQFRRLKVKNKAWVLSSKAKDLVTVSRRSALLAIIKGEIDDVLPLVEKSIADELEAMRDKLRVYLKSVDVEFTRLKASCSDRKTFAIAVTSGTDWSPVYFRLYEGKAATALEWVQDLASAGKLTDSSLDVLLGKVKEQR